MLLETIKKANDIKKIPPDKFPQLAEEIPGFSVGSCQPYRGTFSFQSGGCGAYHGAALCVLSAGG